MTPEQLNQIADLIAKSLEDGVPEAVDAAVEARLKELNLSENADIKEIKAQLKELVEKAKFGSSKEDDLHETKELFVSALKGLRKGDLSGIKAMNTGTAQDGGYLVHPEFEKGVFRIMGDYGIWKDCNVQRMKSDTKYFTKRVEGVQVFYTDQAAAYQDTAMTYDRVQMIAKKVGAILSSTYELIEDEADSDEIWAAAIEYANDNVLCYYYQSLEQEIPYELMVWEGDFDEEDMENYDKAWKDFQETATYSIDLYCGYLPEGIIHAKDFYFDAEGQEPFWYASLRGSLINVFTPSGMDEEYISTLKMDGDDIIFKGYNVNGKLEKTECVDGGKGDTHEYKISFDITKSIYGEDGAIADDKEITKFEGCADKINSGFIKGEEGTMKNFIDKAHYNYSRNFDLDDVYYTIGDIAGRYINVFVYETDGDSYDSYQIILENVDGRYKVLYEGDGYEISEDECEELNQYDNNLMDMFFLRMCPRG